MNSGILICFLGTLSFGLLGCASKGAERKNCQTSALVVMIYIWATAVMLIRSAGVPFLFQRVRITVREVGWSSIIAALSLGGQIAMAVALKLNVPGHVVFPIAIGGSVFIVTLGGRFLFGERLNGLTTSGVSVGLAAITLLSLS